MLFDFFVIRSMWFFHDSTTGDLRPGTWWGLVPQECVVLADRDLRGERDLVTLRVLHFWG